MATTLISRSLVFATGCASTQVAGASTPAPEPQPSAAARSQSQSRSQAGASSALAGPQRSVKNRARDIYSDPAVTLAFFGLTETAHVIELWPGAGWYTEVLAPVLHDAGTLTAAEDAQV